MSRNKRSPADKHDLAVSRRFEELKVDYEARLQLQAWRDAKENPALPKPIQNRAPIPAHITDPLQRHLLGESNGVEISAPEYELWQGAVNERQGKLDTLNTAVMQPDWEFEFHQKEEQHKRTATRCLKEGLTPEFTAMKVGWPIDEVLALRNELKL
jgi:hypothetical protein